MHQEWAVFPSRSARMGRTTRIAGVAFMSLTDLMWLATAAYGLHILEEDQLN